MKAAWTVCFALLCANAASAHPLARCGTPDLFPGDAAKALPGDCTTAQNDPAAEYDPARTRVRIPVVFHVIANTLGEGTVTPEAIASQLAVLNEDFRALAGTPGGQGLDTNIEFYLAVTDPGGQPASGILNYVNDAWFDDAGDYWTPTAWDPARYLNIYTNAARGALGYTPLRPAQANGEKTGTPEDRVVVHWTTVGRNAPTGPPLDQGRTLTHEIGHYLGLEHPFLGGCAPLAQPLCRQTGDLICDTPPLAAAQYGCPSGTASCGNADPTDNYMNYVDDACMHRFTREQARRMHCTLANWRPQLGERTTIEGEGVGEGEGEGEGVGEGEGEGEPLACAETPILDPGFEIGPFGSPWTGASTNFGTPLCRESTCGLNAGLGAYAGTWWAWFGGADGTVEEASLTQNVTFPEAGGLLLTFRLAMPQAGTTGYFRLLVDGTPLFEATEADAPAYTGYTLIALDLSAYADAAPHTLRLEARTEAGDGPLNFFVDALCTETFTPPARHTTDVNGDNRVDLSELLRVIQLYNTLSLHCDPAAEDGYAPGPGDTACAPHDNDYNPQDWRISFSELLRAVQFYNSPGLVPCEGGEDGFCVAG